MMVQLGDRVSVTGYQDGMEFTGDTGFVIRNDTMLGVEFDFPEIIEDRNGSQGCLHSAGDNGQPGSCWNFHADLDDEENDAVVTYLGKRERKKTGFGLFVEKHSL
jgi:hypothetical protein